MLWIFFPILVEIKNLIKKINKTWNMYHLKLRFTDIYWMQIHDKKKGKIEL